MNKNLFFLIYDVSSQANKNVQIISAYCSTNTLQNIVTKKAQSKPDVKYEVYYNAKGVVNMVFITLLKYQNINSTHPTASFL